MQITNYDLIDMLLTPNIPNSYPVDCLLLNFNCNNETGKKLGQVQKHTWRGWCNVEETKNEHDVGGPDWGYVFKQCLRALEYFER